MFYLPGTPPSDKLISYMYALLMVSLTMVLAFRVVDEEKQIDDSQRYVHMYSIDISQLLLRT